MRRNYFLIAALLIAATLIVTVILYPGQPSRIPMHWNWRGEVNRYGDKLEIFLMPAAIIVVALSFAAMPWLSPRRFEVNTFRSTYLYVMLLALAFMAYIHALHLWAAFSKPLDMNRAILGASF